MTNEQLPEEVMQMIAKQSEYHATYRAFGGDWGQDAKKYLSHVAGATFGYRLRDEEVWRLREALENLMKTIPIGPPMNNVYLPGFDEACEAARTALQQTSKKENDG